MIHPFNVYAHVRLRLQRGAMDTRSAALDGPADDESPRDDGDTPQLRGATLHRRCRCVKEGLHAMGAFHRIQDFFT
jgi:hypothetical protein